MSATIEYGDEFEEWCAHNGHMTEAEKAEAFALWIEDTTGWDGTQFSLSEAERHWVRAAKDVLDWLATYGVTGSQEMLDAAMRSLGSVPPFPGSLTIE